MDEVDDRFGAAVAAYETWLQRQPLAASTKREYRRWVRKHRDARRRDAGRRPPVDAA